MCSHMPLEVKRIVESFTTESTRMPLHQAVALQMASQHALQREYLVAHGAYKVARPGGSTRLWLLRREEFKKVLKIRQHQSLFTV